MSLNDPRAKHPDHAIQGDWGAQRATAVESAGSIARDAATARHTEGPWKADRIGCFVCALDGQMPVCEIRGWGYLTGYEKRTNENAVAVQHANAHLIAAAPELLDSCKELREALAALMRVCFQSDCDHSTAWGEELARIGITDGVGVRAQAAIAKAESK